MVEIHFLRKEFRIETSLKLFHFAVTIVGLFHFDLKQFILSGRNFLLFS